MFLSVDCAVKLVQIKKLPWDVKKNVKRLSLEFRTLLVPNFAILARVFQGCMGIKYGKRVEISRDFLFAGL